MARIIDLDIIAPRGVTVRKRVNGRTVDYHLPGDPPVDMWLGIIDAHDEYLGTSGAEQAEALRLFHDRMLDLFRVENPNLESLPFGVAGMFSVLTGFYGTDLDEEDAGDPPGADEAASTTTTKRGSASSAAKKKPATPRSRSSR